MSSPENPSPVPGPNLICVYGPYGPSFERSTETLPSKTYLSTEPKVTLKSADSTLPVAVSIVTVPDSLQPSLNSPEASNTTGAAVACDARATITPSRNTARKAQLGRYAKRRVSGGTSAGIG